MNLLRTSTTATTINKMQFSIKRYRPKRCCYSRAAGSL